MAHAKLSAERQQLGRDLAARRRAAKVTQSQLAREDGRRQSYCSHVELGREKGHRSFWEAVARVVPGGGDLLARFDALQATEARERRLRRGDGEPEATAASDLAAGSVVDKGSQDATGYAARGGGEAPSAELLRPVQTDDAASCLTLTGGRWGRSCSLCGLVAGVDRRGALRLAPKLAALVCVGMTGDDAARMVGVLLAPHRVDARAVEVMTDGLATCKRQEDVLGPAAVLRTVLAQTATLDGLAQGCRDEQVRGALIGLYGSARISAAYYALDLGDPQTARAWCEDARMAAQRSGDHPLEVYALCNMSYIAADSGDQRGMAASAAEAHRVAQRYGLTDGRLWACVHESVATAHAYQGRERECLIALDAARAALASAGAPEGYAYWFSAGPLWSKGAACQAQLGRPKSAVKYAREGARAIGEQFPGILAFCYVREGRAQLALGELDEATRVLGEAAQLAMGHRSDRLVLGLQQAREQMAPWRTYPAVRAFDERLHECGLLVA